MFCHRNASNCSGVEVHLHVFLPFLSRETTFVTLFTFIDGKICHSKVGSTLKGKNLLLEEQILSCKS